MKLHHITSSMICLLAFVDSKLTNCSREELSAAGLEIDVVEEKNAFHRHDFTDRSLAELLKNMPPSVFEDANVRTTVSRY